MIKYGMVETVDWFDVDSGTVVQFPTITYILETPKAPPTGMIEVDSVEVCGYIYLDGVFYKNPEEVSNG